MGSSMSSESFKKLQCAYKVLADSVKKRDYDEQLRKESMAKSVCQKSHSSSHQDNTEYRSEESRRIQCTKCGNSHVWVCTNRSKTKFTHERSKFHCSKKFELAKVLKFQKIPKLELRQNSRRKLSSEYRFRF